jgi:hypothetical protein
MAMQWLVHTIGVITARTGGKRRGGRKGRPFFAQATQLTRIVLNPARLRGGGSLRPVVQSGVWFAAPRHTATKAFSRWRRKLSIPWGSKRPRATGGRGCGEVGGTDQARARGFAQPSMSLNSTPDRSYDLPPADERKGQTSAQRDQHLGNLRVTHWSTLIRYPAGTRAAPRQKNVAGMNYFRRPAAIRPVSAESRGVPRALAGNDRPCDSPNTKPSPAALLESWRGI